MPGIEYKGRYIYVDDPAISFRELWFIAKNAHVPHALQHAKLWTCSRQLGCSYTPDVMQQLADMESRMGRHRMRPSSAADPPSSTSSC